MNGVPLVGKTYSLQDGQGKSDEYYRRISSFADTFLEGTNPGALLSRIQHTRLSKRRIKRFLRKDPAASVESVLVHSLKAQFSDYTANVAKHLEELPLARRWDRTLATSEPQYHLSMVEIELVNRLNTASFRRSDTRLAFLPHCLRDLNADCHSVVRRYDYVCKGCSKICTVNAVTKLLRRHGVTPYIWMTANLRNLLRRLGNEGRNVGVLGIACIPELVNGMRMCMKAGVPVVGIPLDANRCARWWGEFHPNSVNVRMLENLLGDETRITRMSIQSRKTASIGR